jgi:hypothetical protein
MTHSHLLQLSVHSFLWLELVGGAALALWLTARFPRLGPTSLHVAVGFAAAATGAMTAVPYGVKLLTRLPDGGYVALLGCVLPATVVTFLTAAWVLRVLASNLPNSRAY